jgi:hypothetical protein
MNMPWGSIGILFIPAAAAIVTVAGHIMASRLWPRLGIYKAQLVGTALGIPVLMMLTAASWSTPDSGGRAAGNAATYLCFCYVYFHFNNMGETARRIRLLRELVMAGRPLTLADIAARYGAGDIIGRRLARLLAAAQVREIDGRYILADRSVYRMAWAVNLAHRVVFGVRRRNLLERA